MTMLGHLLLFSVLLVSLVASEMKEWTVVEVAQLHLWGEVNLYIIKTTAACSVWRNFCLQLCSCESAVWTWKRWKETVFSCIFCTGKLLLLCILLSVVLLAEKEAGKARNGQLPL